MIVTDSQTTNMQALLQNYEYVNKRQYILANSDNRKNFLQKIELRELEICRETSYNIKKKGHII